MKLIIIKITLFLINFIALSATKPINKTLSIINEINNNNINQMKKIHKKDFPHLSHNNLKLFQKYSEIRKNNSYRLGGEDFNAEFSGKKFVFGSCLIKFKGYIINLYPLSEREGSGFFIKNKRDVFDFDICKNIHTHTGRPGLFVDRNKDIVFAGDAFFEKYFNVGIEENDKNEEGKQRKDEFDDIDLYNESSSENSNLNRVEENCNFNKTFSRPKKSKINKNNIKISNVTVFLPPGDKCRSNKDFDNIVAFRFICDAKSIKPILQNANKFNPNSCFNVIEIRTDKICIQNLINFKIWFQVMNLNKILIAIIIFGIGFFLVFFSDLYRLRSFLFTIGLSTLYTLKFYISDMNYVLFLGILIGMIFLMVFLRNNHDILIYVSSILLSLQVGSFVFNDTARNILENYNITIEQYSILTITIAFFGIFSISSFFADNLFFALIFNTAFGSFLFIRGISIFFGGYPDERYCYILLKYREFDQYDRNFSYTKNIYSISFLALWAFSIVVQHYIIVPVMHKLNQLEKDRKANFKMLNKLGEGYINIDEGSEADNNLLDDEQKNEKLKEDRQINKKANLFGAFLNKIYNDEEKNKNTSLKDDLPKEGNVEEKQDDKALDKEKENVVIFEANSILNLNSEKSFGGKDNKSKKEMNIKTNSKNKKNYKNDENDVYLNTSENIIIEKNKNDFGFVENKDVDSFNDRKREIQSNRNAKMKFDE